MIELDFLAPAQVMVGTVAFGSGSPDAASMFGMYPL